MPAPDRWLVLTARVAADDPLRDLVVEGMLALGGTSVVEHGDHLTTYLPPPADIDTFLRSARERLAAAISAEPPPLSWDWQQNEDWEREWRRGLEPRQVTQRIVVKPSWKPWNAAPGEIVIEIDPQMAFGTGEHATTRSCLRLLDRFLERGDAVLDIGSGSGILSIAAARLDAARVVAVEYDQDANINARENIARNGVTGSIELIERLADPDLLASLGAFDLVLANILSSVIRPLLPALAATIAPRDGVLIVSGILAIEAEAVLADARNAGLELLAEDREEEWWTAALRCGGG